MVFPNYLWLHFANLLSFLKSLTDQNDIENRGQCCCLFCAKTNIFTWNHGNQFWLLIFFMYLKLVFRYLHSQSPMKVLESQENQKIFLFFCLKICGFVANSHCLPLCVEEFWSVAWKRRKSKKEFSSKEMC